MNEFFKMKNLFDAKYQSKRFDISKIEQEMTDSIGSKYKIYKCFRMKNVILKKYQPVFGALNRPNPVVYVYLSDKITVTEENKNTLTDDLACCFNKTNGNETTVWFALNSAKIC